MNYLFFDTETTGLAMFKESVSHPNQPHIVQLAALLTNDKGKELAHMNVLIKPIGFYVPLEASAVHGITTEMCEADGIEAYCAIKLFLSLLQVGKPVAHNLMFDQKVVRVALFRLGFTDIRFDGHCTMNAMTGICRIPGSRGGYKWPKLMEAYKHCFGKEFEKAHDALADVRACAQVFFWLKQNNHI